MTTEGLLENRPETLKGWLDRMKNRLFGLLCEREKNGEWEKFLETIVIELRGLQPQLDSINYWVLLGKVQSLQYLDYKYFRSTIFECMNMISHI